MATSQQKQGRGREAHLVVQEGLALQNETNLVLVQTGLLGQLLLERADEVLLLDSDILCNKQVSENEDQTVWWSLAVVTGTEKVATGQMAVSTDQCLSPAS
jgi:hypothetical protein